MLILIMVVSSQGVLEEASQAGESVIVLQSHTQMIQTVFTIWNVAALFLALYLGAVAMRSEVTAKTLPPILSRPVERSTYLAGRWIGTLSFLWGFELVGLLLGLVMARVWAVPTTPVLWIACAGAFVAVTFASGLSLALSVAVHPALAGVLAYIVPFLPLMVDDATRHPRAIVRLPATAVYYLSPARMPADLFTESFDKQLRHPAYWLYGHVLLENTGYVILVFVIACIVFKRREVQLR